ncbi:hypothetical protein NPIL_245941 [Nephila pilipes]|uniref:Uncharacterized protein n=1 Tax=Nephila pilipes TaxID=299642 RepID=A0A8X6IFR8_NEPPI|nr:hypothetical protein NPIL_245941 [Nephila pilipes]
MRQKSACVGVLKRLDGRSILNYKKIYPRMGHYSFVYTSGSIPTDLLNATYQIHSPPPNSKPLYISHGKIAVDSNQIGLSTMTIAILSSKSHQTINERQQTTIRQPYCCHTRTLRIHGADPSKTAGGTWN